MTHRTCVVLPRCFAVYPLDSRLEAGGAAARRTSCWDTSSFPPGWMEKAESGAICSAASGVPCYRRASSPGELPPPPADRLAGPAGGGMGFFNGIL